MRRQVLCCAVVGMLVTSVFAGDASAETTDLAKKYFATASITPVPGEGLQRLPLTLPILQASRSVQWGDVRVLDRSGQPVPIAWLPRRAIESAQAEAGQTSAPMPLFAWPSPAGKDHSASQGADGQNLRVQVTGSGAIVKIEAFPVTPTGSSKQNVNTPPKSWLVDLSALPPQSTNIHELLLDWPPQPQGLSTRVEIQASDDAERWSHVTVGPLLDLPAEVQDAAASMPPAGTAAPSVKRVRWPAGMATPRYLRLNFDQPLALSSAKLRWPSAPVAEKIDSAPVQFQWVAAEGKESQYWLLDLKGAVPVQQLQVELPQLNTVFGFRLEHRSSLSQPWLSVAPFVAWRLQKQGVEERSQPAQWNSSAATAARHWRLVPDKRTAQLPPEPLHATIGWIAPELLLVAQGASPLQLVVGRNHEVNSGVAWQTLVPGGDSASLARLPQAHLGALTTLGNSSETHLGARLLAADSSEHTRWLLWAVLATAVLGLAGLAWRLARDLKPQQSSVASSDTGA